MPKLHNPCKARIHYSYSVTEISDLYSVHKNTVREWIKKGLPLCDNQKPYLILGSDLREFLQAKRTQNKRKCKNHEMYCLRCKCPRHPFGNMVDYEPLDNALGRLIGICPVCDCIINKYVNCANLAPIQAKLDVTLPKALEGLNHQD